MARPKKQVKLKEPIKIRLKSLADGNKSIYLDIYYKGVRKYEYLSTSSPKSTLSARNRTSRLWRLQNASRQSASKPCMVMAYRTGRQ